MVETKKSSEVKFVAQKMQKWSISPTGFPSPAPLSEVEQGQAPVSVCMSLGVQR